MDSQYSYSSAWEAFPGYPSQNRSPPPWSSYIQKYRLIPPVGTGICLQCRRPGFNPRVGKIPWRRKWQPTPVLLPEEFHGQRSLVDYSPWLTKSQSQLSDQHFTGNLPYTTLNYSLHILSHLP